MGIIKRGDKYWIDYYTRGEGGALLRKREKVGTNYKLAKEILAKRENEAIERRVFPEREKSPVLFQDAAKEFLGWAKTNVSESGFIRYRVSIDNLRIAFEQLNLDQITPALVEKFKTERLRAVAPATVNRDLTVLKRLYNLILKGRILPGARISEFLPVRIAMLREHNQRLRYLSEREFHELLLACERIRIRRRACLRTRSLDLRPIITLAVHTGLRRSEIFGLKWSDVDLAGRVITVHHGKWGSARHVPINSVLAATLEDIPRRLDSPYIFPHADKGPHSGDRFVELKRAWKRLLEEAGISNLRFHDLRHTTASWLVMRGVPLKIVQEILGHKTYLTTLRYAHLAPELRTEAVERLCEENTSHKMDTKPVRTGGMAVRPSVNDGTPRSFDESGGIRTHD
jgi:integrase